ncbi:MAG: IS4 family transposase, partial [Alphaproteobacteria bacterium]|nr:IS4 family transposase [Alphaproteobacteria bacterium]
MNVSGVFLKEQDIDPIIFAKAIISSIWDEPPKMHLILDRTNWKFGRVDINYLSLAVRVGKIVFPLFWQMLDHKGNSDSATRIKLLDQFKNAFGFDKVISFTADREFIGKDWIDYLLNNKIPFFIRIKDNLLANWDQQKRPLKDSFIHLSQDESRHLSHVFDDKCILVVVKKTKGEYLVICSNIKNQDRVLKTYKTRWDIERLFRNMKTQGFHLENTHMKDLDRLSKLMCIVGVAILVACIAGLAQTCAYKKTLKTPLYSYFTRGLRCLKT